MGLPQMSTGDASNMPELNDDCFIGFMTGMAVASIIWIGWIITTGLIV